jgi:hypothetical protein
MYQITPYSRAQARRLGVTIKPSQNKNKKIDVYRDGKFVASIGAIGYKDYPTYMKEDGLEKAKERRRLYKLRHNADRSIVGSPGYYADQILW